MIDLPKDLLDRAEQADAQDPMSALRERFLLPPGTIYLDGNSLGALPVGVPKALAAVVEQQWGNGLIGSWTSAGWWEAPARTGELIAPLIGAAPGQVVVTDSTTINIFKAVVAAARLRPDRTVILVDQDTFPTDRYLVDSAARLLGLTVRPVAPDNTTEFGPEVAVAVFSHVDFRTGVLYDLPGITAAAHAAGALVVWDLCHSVGIHPADLDASEVDLAVGCSYKFLNGGPGAPSWVYVAQRHQDALDQPLPGWHGHANPFAMTQEYLPADGIDRMRVGTAPLLSLLGLEAALAAYDGLDIADVRRRSLSLTGLMIDAVDQLIGDLVEVVTPRDESRRGSQVSLRHPHAFPIVQALIARGVVGDYREPDIVRLGVAPLYLSHADIVRSIAELAQVLDTREYLDPVFAVRHVVT